MEFEAFAYWLQGFVEIGQGKPPTKEQWEVICEHLQTCFKKVTPDHKSLKAAIDALDRSKGPSWHPHDTKIC